MTGTQAPAPPPGRARRMLTHFGTKGSTSRRAAITTIDQSFASISNFAVGIVIARLAGPSALGAYSVAYAIWLLLSAAHRGIVTEPMSIHNDARREEAQERLRAGFAAELVCGVAVALIVMATGIVLLVAGLRDIGIALTAMAFFVPFLLLQDYWRWVGFMQGRPDRSLANDAFFNIVQAVVLIGLILLGMHSAVMAIIAWGLGAVVGALYGLRQFSIRPTVRGGVAMLAERWPMTKWLLASGMVGWGSTQAFPLLAGPFVGPAGLGGLKAAQGLVSGPSLMLLQAGGSMGLPEASHALETGGWEKLARVARWVTTMGMLSVGAIAVAVFIFGDQLLSWIYGPEFAQYANTAKIIAVAWVIQVYAMGSILILKATRQTRLFFHIGVIALVVSTISTVAFSWAWGADGTAWAMVLSCFVSLVCYWIAQRRTERAYRRNIAAFSFDIELVAEESSPDVANYVQHDA